MSAWVDRPRWIGDALVVRCARCTKHERPGSEYRDGSGVCRGCNGATWIVLIYPPPSPEQGETDD